MITSVIKPEDAQRAVAEWAAAPAKVMKILVEF
jgi:hypothetical protein